MPLFSWEWRAAINWGIQITSKNMFYLLGNFDLKGFCVRQLYPILKEVFGYPKYMSIGAFSSLLNHWILWFLFLAHNGSLSNPIISLSTKDFTKEFNTRGTTEYCKPLKRLLKNVNGVFAKVNACPLQHFHFIDNTWQNVLFTLCNKFSVFIGDVGIVFFFDQQFSLLY